MEFEVNHNLGGYDPAILQYVRIKNHPFFSRVSRPLTEKLPLLDHYRQLRTYAVNLFWAETHGETLAGRCSAAGLFSGLLRTDSWRKLEAVQGGQKGVCLAKWRGILAKRGYYMDIVECLRRIPYKLY